MRSFILTCSLFILLSYGVSGQKPDTYKHIYKFQLPGPDESSTLLTDVEPNQEELCTIKGEVINNKSEPLGLVTIIFKNNDGSMATTTNDAGLFEIRVKPSGGDLTITALGYKTLNGHINVEGRNNYNLKATLGKEGTLVWYHIHSNKELKKEEIEKIKKCVKESEQKTEKCKKKNEYYVTLEI